MTAPTNASRSPLWRPTPRANAPAARRAGSHERERTEAKARHRPAEQGTAAGTIVNFLNGCGFDVRRVGNGREYVSSLVGLDDVDVIYFRPEEIPNRVEQGDAHAGITGEDLYREYGEGPPASVLLMPKLGFGGARLVVAVPQSWVDVSTMNDLDEAAMLFHQRHGRSLRVATKFSRLTRAFFSESGIVEYSLVESSGATEGRAGCRRGRFRCRPHLDRNDAGGKSSQGDSGRHRAANRRRA